MQVNSVSSQTVSGATPGAQAAARTVRDDPDQAVFAKTQALNQALSDTPDLRSSEVERARGLISSVKYPPDELIKGISRLLALSKDEASS